MLVKRKYIFRITLVFLCLVFVWRYDFGLTKQIDFANVPIVFAHRGAVTMHPENSVPALLEAFQKGYKAVEVDIVMTIDGTLMLFHDKNSLRLLGVDTPVTEVKAAFFSQNQLLHKDKKSGQYAISLDSFFSILPNHVLVYLDVKTPGLRFADSLVSLIQKYQVSKQVLVANAGFGFLSYIRLKDSRIHTVLEGFGHDKRFLLTLFPIGLKPDFFACAYEQTNDAFLNYLEDKKYLNRLIVYAIKDTTDERAQKIFHKILDAE